MTASKSKDQKTEDLTVLRRIVITMGAILMIGTIGLIFNVIYKLTKDKNQTTTSKEPTLDMIQKTGQIIGDSSGECHFELTGDAINIPLKNKIINISNNNGIMTLHTKSKNKQKILIINSCSGKVINIFNFE